MYFESARQLVIARERNRGQVRLTLFPRISLYITDQLTDFSESARKLTRARIQGYIFKKKETKIDNRATNSEVHLSVN